MTDSQLLAAYARAGDHDAFAQLVRRHVDLVYNACLRQTRGDRHLADDATQAVFLLLARRAGRIGENVVLAGWLYNTARYAAANAVRTETRRRRHEKIAAAAMPLATPPPASASADDDPPSWDQVAPVLDRAIGSLSTPDRDAVLLRYFQNKPFRDVAIALGVSEEAAKKRVSRAVEKLRRAFASRGVATSAAATATLLATVPSQAAPPAVISAACGLALPTTAAASVSALANTTLALTHAKSVAAAIVLATLILAGGTGAALLLAAPPPPTPPPPQAVNATPATAPALATPTPDPAPVNVPALVRNLRAAEAWIDSAKSLTLTAELNWLPAPDPAGPAAAPVPAGTMKLVLGFDDRRLFYREDATDYRLVNRRTWDGSTAVIHEKYGPRQRNQEHYSLDKSPWDVGEFFLADLSWPRVGPHKYWWIPPDRRAEGEDAYGGAPDDFRLAGRQVFRGVDCLVLESDLYYITLHVGVADRRLYGLTNRVFPRRTDRARRAITRQIARDMGAAAVATGEAEDAWLAQLSPDDRKRYDREYFKRLRPFSRPQATHWYADYRQVAPNCWIPMHQGYDLWSDADDDPAAASAEPVVTRTREIRVMSVAVNQPLRDDAFAWDFTEGVEVVDRRVDPFLQYKHKKRFSPDEWQEVLDDAAGRQARRRPAAADAAPGRPRRASPLGKPAPEFPQATWINADPFGVADLAGKAVVVHFWAGKSLDARAAAATLNDLHARAQAAGDAAAIVVVGIHPAGTPADDVRKWVDKYGIRYPVCVDAPAGGSPWTGALFDAYRVPEIPTAYVIDPRGKLVFQGTLDGALGVARKFPPPIPDGL